MLLLLEGERQNLLADCTLAVVFMVLRNFLVLVEGDHLIKKLLSHLVQRSQLERCDAYLYIR